MTDWRHLPPLTSLRAFSAFAEARSVVDAGTALNVSHAAISQQIKALEDHMDVPLVDRSGRKLNLTPEGETLAEALKLGFGAIARSVETLTDADADRPLRISTTPMLAAAWLMPQLGNFHTAYPSISLTLSTTPMIEPIEPGGVEMAIRFGDGNWPGLDATQLFPSSMVIVAAPSLIGAMDICCLEDLRNFTWLEDTGTTEANSWLREIAGEKDNRSGVIQLPGNLLLDAARDGQGVAVVIRAFVEPDIRAGRLSVLLEKDESKGYYVVTRPGVQRAALKTFAGWLRKSAKACEGL